jgi:hypothetical protein
MKTHPFFCRLLWFFALAAMAAVPAAAADSAGTPDAVGEATLVIGVARITSAKGEVRPLDRGTTIHVGDRIETGEGGHVHMRFVDGGRLSVRASSRLQVENYSRSTDKTTLTAIKFRLDEGVVRSVTGAWGEAARDRFRLNTPVAAIGVKGTDFVVKSDANNTLASVYTGAIVLTALAGGCQASLGPCMNGSERLLSEDMKGQMLSLTRQQSSPQLVPLIDLLAQHLRPVAPTAEASPRTDYPLKADVNRADMVSEKVVVSESRAVDVVVTQVATAIQVKQAPAPVALLAPVVPVQIQIGAPLPIAQPVTPVAPVAPVVAVTPVAPVVVVTPVAPVLPVQPVQPTVPVVVQPVLPPEVKQLMWARLAAVATDGDTISRSFAVAMQNGRQGTVGNGAYALFRETSGSAPAQLVTSEASANFRLAGAAAQLVWSDRGRDMIDPVRVDNGTLSVDFNRGTYATQVNVSSARIGTENASSTGIIKPNGLMQFTGGSAFTTGALSLDGKEAGYFFEKPVPAGQLSGITLWGR